MGPVRSRHLVETLASLGEFGFIRQIKRMFPGKTSAIECGIGDDAAVVRLPGTSARRILVTADRGIEVAWIFRWKGFFLLAGFCWYFG